MQLASNSLETFKAELINNACYRMDESLRMVSIALAKITEEQLWQAPNTSLNSIGNLILHLCGNMAQYGIASLQETEDKRDRDQEFATTGGYTKAQLLAKLETTVVAVKNSFTTVAIDRLLKVKPVQGFALSGIGNMIHVVEHFSYHTGQIAFWVKQQHNAPLGFYDGLDLNVLNE